MANRDYGNGLGVAVTYGPFENSQFGACVSTFGYRRQAVIPYGKRGIPQPEGDVSDRYITPEAAARDPEGDSLVFTIPANSFVTAARFYTFESFEDGTTVSVGANDENGNGNDAGFISNVGSTTAGTWTEGEGAFVGTTVGDNPLQFSSSAEEVDTGSGVLILEFITVPVV